MGPPAHWTVPGALELAPPGQMEICTRAGVCGKAHWLDEAFHVSDRFLTRPTWPSTSQVMSSGVHLISYVWKLLYVSDSEMLAELSSGARVSQQAGRNKEKKNAQFGMPWK